MISLREPSLFTLGLGSGLMALAFFMQSLALALVAEVVLLAWLAFGLILTWSRPDIVLEKQRKTGAPATGKLPGEQYYIRVVLIGLLAHAAWTCFKAL
ncbi:hypothetical protein [Taklimakanibacter deserti]|uniref:hypothetical protein n=1 Tax=Taklimakanibacter deserti TaxID=2267839 RepID=UPI000E65A1A0